MNSNVCTDSKTAYFYKSTASGIFPKEQICTTDGVAFRKLDGEANKFFDRKHEPYHTALLTRYYTQHALRPYIDSEMNRIRQYIKIPFMNKGIDFIDLPSIFRNNTVESSIPDYFENKEPPIICYKYNKPIRSTIFNFNKFGAILHIDTKTPDS